MPKHYHIGQTVFETATKKAYQITHIWNEGEVTYYELKGRNEFLNTGLFIDEIRITTKELLNKFGTTK